MKVLYCIGGEIREYMLILQQAIKGVKWTTLSTALTSGLQIIQLIVLARLLSPKDFGLMAMVMVIIGFAQAFADMGVSAAIIHKQDVTSQQLSSLYWLNVLTGVLVFLLVCAVTPIIVIFFNEPRLANILPFVAVSFLIQPFGIQFQMLFQKELHFNVLAIQEILVALVSTIVAVSGAWMGLGVWALVWGYLIGEGVKTLILIVTGWPKWAPRLYFQRNDLTGYLSFGFYQMGERCINYFNSRIDQLLVGLLLGTEALGYYNFAFNIVIQPTLRINPIFTKVAFPVLSKIQNENSLLKQSYIKVINLINTINAPLLIGLVIVSPIIVPVIFGYQWIPAIPLIQIMSLFAFFRSIVNPIGSLLLACGRADLSFKWNFSLLFTTTPVIYIGAKLGGYIGVALALVTIQFIYLLLNYLFLVRTLIGPCAKIYTMSILKPASAAVIMGLGVWLLTQLGSTTIKWLLAYILLGGVVYIGMLHLFYDNFYGDLKMVITGKK